jgi:hypothetical protein
MAEGSNGSRLHSHCHIGEGRVAAISANPISNLLYDWLTVLQSKAEAINAYEKYGRPPVGAAARSGDRAATAGAALRPGQSLRRAG